MMIKGPSWLLITLTKEEKAALANSKPIVRGTSIYALCWNCNTIVKANKWLLGSYHLCN
jgi:hypothetical protein